MATKIFFISKTFLLALSLFGGLSVVYAWTAPTATPPSSNASAPINVSGVDQTKLGDICTVKGGSTKCLSTGTELPAATIVGQTVRWDGSAWGISNEGDVLANGVIVGRGGGNVSSNTVTSYSALVANTTGTYNTAMGVDALAANIAGTGNTANGGAALQYNTTGGYNLAIGATTLYRNTTGSYNTGIGSNSLRENSAGSYNTTMAIVSLSSNTTGNYNTSIGGAGLYSNTTGSYNTATGYSALTRNSTGSYNTSSGVNSMEFNLSGLYNVASGRAALKRNSTGSYNTAVGTGALLGANNTEFSDPLIGNVTGSRNTALGYWANVSAGNLTNATAIGKGAVVDASNKVRIGNTAVTVIGGSVAWSNLSDIRAKEDITNYTHGLDLITKLRPVEYKLKADSTKKVHSGFIAQEVEAIGIPFYGLNKPESKEGYYSLSYDEIVIPLVNSAKELKSENDKINSENDILRARLEKLEAKVNSL